MSRSRLALAALTALLTLTLVACGSTVTITGSAAPTNTPAPTATPAPVATSTPTGPSCPTGLNRFGPAGGYYCLKIPGTWGVVVTDPSKVSGIADLTYLSDTITGNNVLTFAYLQPSLAAADCYKDTGCMVTTCNTFITKIIGSPAHAATPGVPLSADIAKIGKYNGAGVTIPFNWAVSGATTFNAVCNYVNTGGTAFMETIVSGPTTISADQMTLFQSLTFIP